MGSEKIDNIGVCIFLYNRYIETTNLINSINMSNDKKGLFFMFFLDGPKSQNDLVVQNQIKRDVNLFLTKNNGDLICRDTNYGLILNIMDGVSNASNRFKKIIVLEDDLIFAKSFFLFMKVNLEFYLNDKTISSISGFNYFGKDFEHNIYITSYGDCLAWGTWSDRWNEFVLMSKPDDYAEKIKNKKQIKSFNRNNAYPYYQLLVNQKRKNTSWAIKWYAHNFLQNKNMIFSGVNLVRHAPISASTNYNYANNDPLDCKINDCASVISPLDNSDIICGDVLLESWLKTFPLKSVRRLLLYLGLNKI